MAWTSYSPADFLLFAPRTYWRLFELQNEALWPLTPALPVLGLLAILAALRGGGAGRRLAFAAVAAGWAASGLLFVGGRYAEINWAVERVWWIFVAQAMLLLAAGAVLDRLRPAVEAGPRGAIGLALAVGAVAGYPLLAPLDGRGLAQVEIAGIAPDPTALLTLGLLALARPGLLPAFLCLVPAAWCAASAATLLTMGAWQGWVLAGTALAGLIVRLSPGRAAGRR